MSGWAAAAMAAEKAFDTGFSVWSASRANRQARSNIRMQNEFNKHNYRHRYQWAMEDMREAGLNPILAYGGVGGGVGGAGAAPATPVGPSSAKGTVTEAMNYQIAKQTLKNAKAEEARIFEDVGLKAAQNRESTARRLNVDANTNLVNHTAESAKAKATSDKQKEELYQKVPELRKWEAIRDALSPFIGGKR